MSQSLSLVFEVQSLSVLLILSSIWVSVITVQRFRLMISSYWLSINQMKRAIFCLSQVEQVELEILVIINSATSMLNTFTAISWFGAPIASLRASGAVDWMGGQVIGVVVYALLLAVCCHHHHWHVHVHHNYHVMFLLLCLLHMSRKEVQVIHCGDHDLTSCSSSGIVERVWLCC